LPQVFYAPATPAIPPAEKLIIFNDILAQDLGIDISAAEFLSGKSIPPGAAPIAQAYAGHQFGRFTMLGDGRAILLGEIVTPKGDRVDLQLKGAGRTHYSRRGDGKAALGPMLREYLISEAMHALGIPTTRSLAVVATGEPVYREITLPGAVLTRVAASHLRVGTFEYASTQGVEPVRSLLNYAIQRHYPTCSTADNPTLAFFDAVADRQAKLIALWMAFGFIHGVMNTDNMSIAGETIDYGPCAFMDAFDAGAVFSSIDQNGRYAFGNQPKIASWNLARLAESLLPLMHDDEKEAIALAQGALERFGVVFNKYWLELMCAKMGLNARDAAAEKRVTEFLAELQESNADFTNAFRSLGFHDANPVVIPRNYFVEEALTAATLGDMGSFNKLLAAVQNPFVETADNERYRNAGPRVEGYRTFCGT